MPILIVNLATWLGGKLLGRMFSGGAAKPSSGYLIIGLVVAAVAGFFYIQHKSAQVEEAHETIGQLRSDLTVAVRAAETSAAEARRIENSYKDQLAQLTRQRQELTEQRSQVGTAVRRSNDAARVNDPVCGGVCDAFFDSLRGAAPAANSPGNPAGAGRPSGLPAGVPRAP